MIPARAAPIQSTERTIGEAASERVDALNLTGPARRARLRNSARDLEALAPTLPDDLRAMALELARTNDRALAADLRDELSQRAPPPAPPAEQEPGSPGRSVGAFLWDNVGKVALGALIVAGVGAGIAYFTRDEPIGQQVDEVRADLRGQRMEVEYRELRLGQGGPSHLFVAASTPDRTGEVAPKADEVRIYDERQGSLDQTLAYRPVVRFVGSNQRPVGASFELLTVRDIDGDGQKEVLGSYETNAAGSEFQRAPVLISRRSGDADYEVSALLDVASLPRAATAGLTLLRLSLPGGGSSAQAAWVSDFGLETGPFPLRRRSILVTSVIVPGGAGGAPVRPLEVSVPDALPKLVRFWEIDMEGGAPVVKPMCMRAEVEGSSELALPARFSDIQALLRESLRQVAESGALGQLVDGNCFELSS